MPKIGFRLAIICLAFLAIFAFLIGDEIFMFKAFGTSRGIVCSDGQLRGARASAQHVCISEETVVKVSRPCTDARLDKIFDCKYLYWKQIYTNKRWSLYSKSPLIPNLLSSHGKDGKVDGIVMERVKFPKDQKKIKPDFKFNLENLLAFDEMLAKNGHIALDIQPFTNVVLDDSGKMHIIDFNIMPSWLRADTERNDEWCFKLPPFKNIYGGYKVLNWVVPGGHKAST